MTNFQRQMARAKALSAVQTVSPKPQPERQPSAERVAVAREAVAKAATAKPSKEAGLARVELEAVVEVLRGKDPSGNLAAEIIAALRSSRASYLKAYRLKKASRPVPF